MVRRVDHTQRTPKAARSVRARGTVGERAVALHKKLTGKIEVTSKVPLSRDTLELVYTPGVGEVCKRIAGDRAVARTYTGIGRTIAVVSDGSAVLGLGNIGPEAAMPVMEGKALLFKELAGIDAVPIVLGTSDPAEIVQAIRAIAPSFAGINLEDIRAPQCFAVEEELQRVLDIPVMHDDQHGTAIVVLAALKNAYKVVEKDMMRSRVAIIGAGAAASATARLLLEHGIGDIIMVDQVGILSELRADLPLHKQELVERTNREGRIGGIREAIAGADAVIGLATGGLILPEHVRVMAQRPIVLALSNPTPEIMPEEAHAAGALIVATGRSDYPNQVNNALVFPGMFRGALDHGVTRFTTAMQLRAADALARIVVRPTARKILPTLFDARVVTSVARAIVP